VVRDLTQAAIQEAQRGNVSAENLLRACDVGAIGGGDSAYLRLRNKWQLPHRYSYGQNKSIPQLSQRTQLRNRKAHQDGDPNREGPETQSAPQFVATFRKPGRIPASEMWLQDPVDVEGSPC
jgi:hypothetical protein